MIVRRPEFHLDQRHLRLYRDRTRAILRRYFRISLETGRLPSLLGRECFRTKLNSYRNVSFEDAVIFVHDIEGCLNKLDPFFKQLIALIALQGYQEEDAAARLRCSLRTVERCYGEALDKLTEVFLQVGIIEIFPCQEASDKETS